MSNIVQNIASKLSGSHSPSNKDSKGNNPTSGGNTNPTHDGPKGDHTKGKDPKNEEPTFSILPHPAKTNDPADLQPGGGLRSSGGAGMDMFNTPGPYVPKDDIKNNLPAPLSHEELQARQAALRSEVPGHGTTQGNIL